MTNDQNDARAFLDSVYTIGDVDATKSLYDAWAASYDAELKANGYVTPGRCAEALASLVEDAGAPIADLGCGTGLSGLALRGAGFTAIDGYDMSEAMLAQARAHGCYRHLGVADLSQAFEPEHGPYAHAVAAGVVSPGHAPAESILTVITSLPPGGVFIFSLNDHALADRSFEGRVNEVVDAGYASIVFKEYGPHIPARALNAMIYGLRKS